MALFGGNGSGGGSSMTIMLLIGAVCCLCFLSAACGGVYFYSRGSGLSFGIGQPTTAPAAAAATDYVDYVETTAPATSFGTSMTLPTCGVTYNPAWDNRETPPYDAASCKNELMKKDSTCTQYQSVESPPGSGRWEWLRRGVLPGCSAPGVGVGLMRPVRVMPGGRPGAGASKGGAGGSASSGQVINTGTMNNRGSGGIFGSGGVFGTRR